MADLTLKASPEGVRRIARSLRSGGRLLHGMLVDEMNRGLAPGLVQVHRTAAPKGETRKLSQSIRSESSTQAAKATVQVTSNARSPEGFRYTGVTRVGHRAGRIFPRHSITEHRYIAPIPGVGPRWVTTAPALAFRIGGRLLFRRSVAGYHPASDWVQDARGDVNRELDRGVVRLVHAMGRRL